MYPQPIAVPESPIVIARATFDPFPLAIWVPLYGVGVAIGVGVDVMSAGVGVGPGLGGLKSRSNSLLFSLT